MAISSKLHSRFTRQDDHGTMNSSNPPIVPSPVPPHDPASVVPERVLRMLATAFGLTLLSNFLLWPATPGLSWGLFILACGTALALNRLRGAWSRISVVLFATLFATACQSAVENHVGIVFHDPKKGWLVAESAVPLSRYTTLEKFIARSNGGWCEIRRLKTGLTEAQVKALRAQCDARMNIVYHTGFRYESPRMFCSKFVYDVYRSALGVEIGELETFSHLLDRNPEAGLGFWRVWFFGRIPWNRITVTPASQFESGLLKTIWHSDDCDRATTQPTNFSLVVG